MTDNKPHESKEELRDKIWKYLIDPESEEFSRKYIALEVLGYSDVQNLYKMFTPDELNQIYADALPERRKRYASLLMGADFGLAKSVKKGDPQAIKLMYQKFEGWSEKTISELEGGINLKVTYENSRKKAD